MSRQEMCETGDGSLANFEPKTELGEIDDIPELLKTYHELGLGRAIMLVSEDPVTNTTSRDLGGYILPTPDELEHLVILSTGEMYFVGPRSDSEDDKNKYRYMHNPSNFDYNYKQSPNLFEEGTKGLSYFMEANLEMFSQTITSSNKYGVDDEFIKKIGDSVDTALLMRRQRSQGLEISRGVLLKKGVTGPNYTPREQQPTNSAPHVGLASKEEILWENSSGEDFCIIE